MLYERYENIDVYFTAIKVCVDIRVKIVYERVDKSYNNIINYSPSKGSNNEFN